MLDLSISRSSSSCSKQPTTSRYSPGLLIFATNKEGRGFVYPKKRPLFTENPRRRLLGNPYSARTFPMPKYIKRCIEILPLGDAAVSPPELLCLSREKELGERSRKDTATIEAGEYLHQRHDRPPSFSPMANPHVCGAIVSVIRSDEFAMNL